jgi:hypothetical protein
MLKHPLPNNLKELMKISNGFPKEVKLRLIVVMDHLQTDDALSDVADGCWRIFWIQPIVY